jgi:DNA-binding response OmpR family regulator
MNNGNKILVVDDTIENLNILKVILEKEHYEVFLSKDGYKAFEIAKELKPNLILLDILMPNIDGYETCKMLKECKDTRDIPVIFLSALTSVEDKIKAFDIGAIDYIPKPIHDKEVLARVKAHLQTSMMIHSLNDLVEKSFHEIYTPLSVMSTGLEMQVLEHGDTEYLQSIKSAIRLLNVFSDDMYYAIKKEIANFEPEWIELKPFIKKQLTYIAPIAKSRRMDFSFESSVENPMIYINDIELQRILLNVLSNALKYGYKNTTIGIKVKMHDENRISFSIENRGKILQNPDKIFEKLYQDNSEHFGLGIGLEIVAVVCNKNDIDIKVTSVNNKTKFKFIYKEAK